MQGIYAFRQCFGSYPESNNSEHIQQTMTLVLKLLASVISG
jgi:hypothetical protein